MNKSSFCKNNTFMERKGQLDNYRDDLKNTLNIATKLVFFLFKRTIDTFNSQVQSRLIDYSRNINRLTSHFNNRRQVDVSGGLKVQPGLKKALFYPPES